MPDPRTVVYKPGNLDIDAQLFGKPRGGIANSLAQDLDPAGTKISQYTILSQQDAATQEKYGFMEFVRSDGPVTATDLLSVYESLAANMALSYLVGLEDVHQENVLLLRDRIQVIDMEATTGRFGVSRTPGGVDVTQGGFKAQLWTKALAEGIRPKLEARARNRQLQAVPSTGTAAISMASTFLRVIRQAEGVGFNGQWLAHTQALAGFTSRIVPITTEDFYRAILPARRVGSYSQWLLYLNGDPADPEHQTPATAKGNWLVAQACAFTHANIDFARRVLASPGAYNALNRGEVPYFTRDLNTSNQIMDEEGNAIPVNPGDISKIGSAIDTEMDTRRNALQSGRQEKSDVLAIFSAQIIQYIQQLNDDLLRLLRPARRRP